MANTSQSIILETTDTLELGGHTKKGPVLQRVVNLLNGLRSGSKRGVSMQVQYGGAPLMPSVAHIKLTSCAADTIIEINGVPFIAIAGTVVSGNNEFDIDGSDAADAASLASAINSSTHANISGIVRAVNQLKEIITPAGARTGTITFTLADGTVHTFIGQNAAVTVGQPTFDYRTSVAATTASITAQVNGYAPFTNKIYAVDGTTHVTLRSLDGELFTLLGTASTMAESGGTTVTLSSKLKGGLANAITVKPGGVRANAVITCAAVEADDTITINGSAITGKAQRATGTITASSVDAGDAVTIAGTTFTAVAGAVTLGTTSFSKDTGNNETATSLAAQINGYAPFSGFLTATASSAVVTVRAVTAGTAANTLTLTTTDGTDLAVSGSGTLTDAIAVANDQFDISAGSTNTQVATDIARCINASTTAAIRDNVFATSDADTVTIWSKHPGTIGNAITIATINATRLAITGSVSRLAGGTEAQVGGAQATGTLTLTSVANSETCTINGVTLTAHTNTDANNQFRIDGDDTADAVALARAINTSTTAALQDVIATSSTNVVTVTARRGGPAGNNITLASGQGTIVANVARLASGAVPTAVVIANPTSATQTNGATTMSNGAGGAGTYVNVTL